MRMTFPVISAVALVVLIDTDRAMAWGPATHIGLADTVWGQLGAVPAALAALLGRNRIPFLFGSIAADMVFAKRLSRVKQFCHHWSTGFALLGAARDERAQAFAQGYLSHLAADTVAHGKYVPRQIILSGSSVNFGHFYWELRADSAAGQDAWTLLKEVLDHDHDTHHQVLNRHISGTFLPYGMNRAVFRAINELCMDQNVRRSLATWHRYSPKGLDAGLLEAYRAECVDRMISVLSEGERSPVLREDPNGTPAFMQLKVRRRERRRLGRRGCVADLSLREASLGLAPRATGDVQDPAHTTSS